MTRSRRISDETWAAIRRAYDETAEPVTSIAARFACARSTIQQRIANESWPPRGHVDRHVTPRPLPDDGAEMHDGAGADPAVAPSPGSVPMPLPLPVPHVPPTALERSDRLYRLIDLQLESLELDMTRKKNVSPQDQERRARAVTMLLANLDHVRETVADLFKTDANDGARKDAEQKRQEIAERLERLAGEGTPRS